MAVTVQASGTQAATLATEHILSGAAITAAGVFQLNVDASALALGETLTLRVYSIELNAGTEHLEEEFTFFGALGAPMIRDLARPSDISIKYTLQQDGGTGRSYPWKVLKIA